MMVPTMRGRAARVRLSPMLAIVAALALAAPAAAQRANDPAAEAVIGAQVRAHPAIAENGMVAAQDAIAARVGIDILRQGGNAVDAAVAVGFAMAVTHPQAGNLGGGGFMVIALAGRSREQGQPQDQRQAQGEGRAFAIDYREMAPRAATRDMFLGADGQVDTDKARFSHASAGVPGTVAGLLHALERHGTLPRAAVLAPAIRLAEDGFPVSREFAFAIARTMARFAKDPSSLAIFQRADGQPLQPGDMLRQPDLARTLAAIRDRGATGFYGGWVADAIVAEMERGAGTITREDLAAYKVIERVPARGTYRGHEIVSMPPPSSGGVHLIQMLNILEGYDLKALGPNSADTLHRVVEAARRAYADRAEHMGDPDFPRADGRPMPVAGLIAKSYAARLRGGIDLAKATPSAAVSAGTPPAAEGEQTTHFSVIDRDGNAVANTYTLNFAFGSGLSVDGAGFLLNNEMDDFSAKPGSPNAFGLLGGEANAIAPAKRPLSSMTPTIVLKDGGPVLATGSLGGSTIITVVLQLVLNMVDFDMNIAEATAAPRIHHQWQPDTVISEPGISPDTLRLLEARGFILPKEADGRFQHRILGRANSVGRVGRFFVGAADGRTMDAAAVGY